MRTIIALFSLLVLSLAFLQGASARRAYDSYGLTEQQKKDILTGKRRRTPRKRVVRKRKQQAPTTQKKTSRVSNPQTTNARQPSLQEVAADIQRIENALPRYPTGLSSFKGLQPPVSIDVPGRQPASKRSKRKESSSES